MLGDPLVPVYDSIINDQNLLLFAIGGFLIFFACISLFVKERLYLSEAFVAVLFGIFIGPACLDIFNPYKIVDHNAIATVESTSITHFGSLEKFTLEISRIIIGIQVMAVGIALPKNYIWKKRKSLGILLGPIMVAMWIISAIPIHVVYVMWDENASFLCSLAIAACITPTDPILASSILKGKFADKHIPINLRLLITAESGVNDGLGLPFLFFSLYLLRPEFTVGQSLTDWVYRIWGYQVALSILLGVIVGYAARKALQFSERKDLIDKESFFSFSIALTFFTLGAVAFIASDDLLSVFVAGTVLSWDNWMNERVDESFQEVIDSLFNMTFFVFFGAILPWASMAALGIWKLCLVAFGVLVFRRIPIVLLFYKLKAIPAITTFKEAFFTGHFGPIGVGAIFYSLLTYENILPHVGGAAEVSEEIVRVAPEFLPIQKLVIPVVFFLVLSSVIVHGITVPLFHFTIKKAQTRKQRRRVKRLLRRYSVDYNKRMMEEDTNITETDFVISDEGEDDVVKTADVNGEEEGDLETHELETEVDLVEQDVTVIDVAAYEKQKGKHYNGHL